MPTLRVQPGPRTLPAKVMEDPSIDDFKVTGQLLTPTYTSTEVALRQQEAEKAMRQNINDLYVAGLTANALPRISREVNMAEQSNPYDLNNAAVRTRMMCMRLRVPPDNFPFRHFTTILANGIVYVTIVMPNGPVMFEDDAVLFPSDTLMSSLRLLL